MAKLKTARAVGALMDALEANDNLKDQLAKLQAEALELVMADAEYNAALEAYEHARDSEKDSGYTESRERLTRADTHRKAALAQPMIKALEGEKHD